MALLDLDALPISDLEHALRMVDRSLKEEPDSPPLLIPPRLRNLSDSQWQQMFVIYSLLMSQRRDSQIH